MIPELHARLSDSTVDGLCVDNADVRDDNLRLCRTELGATVFASIDRAPSFVDRYHAADASYFSNSRRVELVLSKLLRQRHQLVYDAVSDKYRKISLFVRGVEVPNWHYVGEANLNSVLGVEDVHWKYTFDLAERLSYDLWTGFGGYRKWLLSVGKNEYQCANNDECMTIIQTQWGNLADDIEILRYEGDSLRAFTNSKFECVVSYFKDDEWENVSCNSKYEGDAEKSVEFYTATGHDMTMSANWVITKNQALDIIRTFLATGVLGTMRI